MQLKRIRLFLIKFSSTNVLQLNIFANGVYSKMEFFLALASVMPGFLFSEEEKKLSINCLGVARRSPLRYVLNTAMSPNRSIIKWEELKEFSMAVVFEFYFCSWPILRSKAFPMQRVIGSKYIWNFVKIREVLLTIEQWYWKICRVAKNGVKEVSCRPLTGDKKNKIQKTKQNNSKFLWHYKVYTTTPIYN